MLGMFFLVIGGFVLAVVRSYRRSGGAGKGEPFRPEGKLRWTDHPTP
jgi:hypothetical protein